tara:strand:- start:72 stop:311 length:240 start_codon:yes stop_codon:yes gene_type:complete
MTDTPKEQKELTGFELQQKAFIADQYPMLPGDLIETMVRLTEEQKDDIVSKMKSGELKHEEPKPAHEYIIQSVKVSGDN